MQHGRATSHSMKILILSALYPPNAFGGAEDCAHSFATWAALNGHSVAVAMAAKDIAEVGRSTEPSGVNIWRLATPHIYPVASFRSATRAAKPIWHLQDHFSAGTRQPLEQILADFKPDIAIVHIIQGLGYRMLDALAEHQVPIAFVLHDLGLACIRMSMFINNQNCSKQCLACRLSSSYKRRLIVKANRKARTGFISPSQANLDTLDEYFPVKSFQHAVIPNPKSYPSSLTSRTPSKSLRLIYAGKLEEAKGVHILLQAVDEVASEKHISLTLAGAGPLLEEIQRSYDPKPWFRYVGFLAQQDLSNEMAQADLLCVPSLWQENFPGVVVHAQSLGLPVLANRRGGIPEIVENQVTGVLLDHFSVKDWKQALIDLSDEPRRVTRLQKGADMHKERFDIDGLGNRTIEFLSSLIRSD